uniref:Prolactin-releasing peptide n=1 Tax=Pyxicephalus adspersus TaxID=30357 RepID=A0AAV3AEA7_PYXAD|nr:TPA: hypothetical protein GDO54_012465 [Pyxicephalus adspersus]
MLYTESWPSTQQPSCRPKLSTLYMLLLLVSISIISVQSRSLNHQIDNRSPEIDPYWYVGRGVRPIGRFGKRQVKNRNSLQPRIRSLFELIVSCMDKNNGPNLDTMLKAERW